VTVALALTRRSTIFTVPAITRPRRPAIWPCITDSHAKLMTCQGQRWAHILPGG
jgi:hypothetical protein